MIYMVDSTDRGVIPVDAAAVAGYCGQHNHYQSFWWFKEDFPHAIVVPVLAFAQDYLDEVDQNICLDIEPGNSGPETAPGFIQREHARGVIRPIIYAARADMQAALGYCDRAGIARSSYRRWVAHPDGVAHICTSSRCGYDCDGTEASQYVWNPGGRNIDISLCADSFFASAPPQPLPPKPEDTVAITATMNKNGAVEVFVEKKDESIWHTWQNVDSKGHITGWNGGQAGKRIAGWERLGTPGS